LIATVVGVYAQYIVGTVTTVKKVDFVDSAIGGLLTYSEYVADGLGLVEEDNDTFPFRVLHGARINGRQFGIVGSVDAERSQSKPRLITLDQNYPNPFNGVTNIRFYLPKRMNARLRVYNVVGQLVQNVNEGSLVSGTHLVRIIADRWASGTYFAVLEAEGTRAIRRIVLIR